MKLVQLRLKNWRNFRDITVDFDKRAFIVGANATGKSNLIDAFQFVADVARNGGGLKSAVDSRGGLNNLRYINARNFDHGHVHFIIWFDDDATHWSYELEIASEPAGIHRPIVSCERVTKDDEVILDRPDQADEEDSERLTQTHLEQISSNITFRKIARFLSSTTYFHLSPQVIRSSYAPTVEETRRGGNLLSAISQTPERIRRSRLKKIEQGLISAVPKFRSLDFQTDAQGQPHLVAGYENWRPHLAKQHETEFSDGTLRLIGLLWTIISQPKNSGLLLLEEPELFLNSAIVQTLPTLFAEAQKGTGIQVIATTHSPDMLIDPGIAPSEVIVLTPGKDATQANQLSEITEARGYVEAGVPIDQIVNQLVNPSDVDLWPEAVG